MPFGSASLAAQLALPATLQRFASLAQAAIVPRHSEMVLACALSAILRHKAHSASRAALKAITLTVCFTPVLLVIHNVPHVLAPQTPNVSNVVPTIIFTDLLAILPAQEVSMLMLAP
jgi:hypothetical protein